MYNVQKTKKKLEDSRLDLDSSKNKLKNAKNDEQKTKVCFWFPINNVIYFSGRTKFDIILKHLSVFRVNRVPYLKGPSKISYELIRWQSKFIQILLFDCFFDL